MCRQWWMFWIHTCRQTGWASHQVCVWPAANNLHLVCACASGVFASCFELRHAALVVLSGLRDREFMVMSYTLQGLFGA